MFLHVDWERDSSLLQSIYNHVTDGIMVVDTNGFIISANKAMSLMTGWSTDELSEGIHMCEVCRGVATCYDEQSCQECFTRSFHSQSFEMQLQRKDGTLQSVTASASYLPGEKGSMVLIVRDMSEQYQTERERQKNKLMRQVIEAQEDERKRISRDLHDGVGQALYCILISLQVLQNQEHSSGIKQLLDEVRQMTQRAMDDAKSLSIDLRPSTLDDLGLVAAIRSLCNRIEKTFRIKIIFRADGLDCRFDSAIETAMYRICQEAINNAVKYSNSSSIEVDLIKTNSEVKMSIVDFGKGFNLLQPEILGSGLGLFGMKERAHLVGGEAIIESQEGRGTQVVVTIPLYKEEIALYANTNSNRG